MANNIIHSFFFFRENKAWKIIHIKFQALFSLQKNKQTNIECHIHNDFEWHFELNPHHAE